MTGVVERSADCGDAAVHHVARGDGVRSRLDVADGGALKQRQRLVVVDLVAVEDSAMPVRRVLAEADVREQNELGVAVAERSQGALDDPVVVVRAGALLVLLLRDPEQQQCFHTEAAQLVRLADDAVDGVARKTRQLVVGERLRAHEQRHDEVVEREARLAHEPAQPGRPPKPPQPRDGKRAHGVQTRPCRSGQVCKKRHTFGTRGSDRGVFSPVELAVRARCRSTDSVDVRRVVDHASSLRIATRAPAPKTAPRPTSHPSSRATVPQGCVSYNEDEK